MAGALTISTLNDSSGVLATQNGMSGIAKAWVQFTGATTPTINASFNVSSVTYVSTGFWTVNFTTALPDANYSVVGSCGTVSSGNGSIVGTYDTGAVPTTTALRLYTIQYNGTLTNPTRVSIGIFR